MIKLVLVYFYWQRIQEEKSWGLGGLQLTRKRGEKSRGVAEVGVDRSVTGEGRWWIRKGDPACAGGEGLRCKKGSGSISPR